MEKKIRDLEINIPDISGLVKKRDYKAKVLDIEEKYFTSSDYNKFTTETLDTKLKQANLAANSDLNTASQVANKNKEKTEKVQTFNLSYFLSKDFYWRLWFSKFVCLSTKI